MKKFAMPRVDTPPRRPSAATCTRSVAFLLSLTSLAVGGRGFAADDPDAPGTEQANDREIPATASPPEPLPPEAPAPVAPDRNRRTAIYGILGIGTPVGVIGVEAVHRFGRVLEIAGGVGVGESASASEASPSIGHVLQWSVMPRVHAGRDDHNAFTLGVGVSGGQYGGIQAFGLGPGCFSDGYACTGFPTRYVLWGNVEIGGEHWRGGVAFRYFLGYAVGTTLFPTGRAVDGGLSIPYAGIGLGFTF